MGFLNESEFFVLCRGGCCTGGASFAGLGMCIIILFLCPGTALSQSVTTGGSYGVHGELYSISGRESRRPPSTGMIFIRPEIRAYGMSVLVDITMSSEENSVRQSFNRFAIEPSWSWGGLKVGDFTTFHSPYTLNGTTLRGAGLSLSPGLFRFSSAWGRANRAVESGTGTFFPEAAAYKRTAWAIKVGAGRDDESFIDLNVFKAKDDALSIQGPAGVTPEENLIISLNMKLGLLNNRLRLQTEQAAALHSRDIRSQSMTIDELPGWAHHIYNARLSTRFGIAQSFSAGLEAGQLALDTRYRVINPGFVSLGSPWLQNDIRDWTVSPVIRLTENRGSIRLSHTDRRDNLENDKRFTTRSRRSTAGVNLRVSRRFSVNSSAGLYRSMIDDSHGTRNRTWQTLNWQLQPVWNFTIRDRRNSISMSWRHQTGRDRVQRDAITREHSSNSATVQLTTHLTERLSVGPGFMRLYQSRIGQTNTTQTLSLSSNYRFRTPDLSARIEVGTTGNRSFDSYRNTRWHMDGRAVYRPWPGHHLTLRITNTGFGSDNPMLNSFTEFRGQLQYTRNF